MSLERNKESEILTMLKIYLDNIDSFITLKITLNGQKEISHYHGDEFEETMMGIAVLSLKNNMVQVNGVTTSSVKRGGRNTLFICIGVDNYRTKGQVDIIVNELLKKANLSENTYIYKHKKQGDFPGVNHELQAKKIYSYLRQSNVNIKQLPLTKVLKNCVDYNSIKQALFNDEIRAQVQPIHDAEGVIVGFEALARWYKRDGSHLNVAFPDEFIPQVYHYGLGVELAIKMLEESATILEAIKKITGEYLKVSFNICPSDLCSPKMLSVLKKFSKYNPTQHIEIEVTEGEAYENSAIYNETLTKIKSLGYTIALDDFGSKYAWFGRVSHLLDTVKIDGELVKKVNVDKVTHSILKAICDVCKKHNIQIVAEHIESKEEMKTMRDMGVSKFQGHFFSKAMDIEMLPNAFGFQHVLNSL